VQDGRTYIELINAPSLYQFKGRLPRCLIDAADRGCIRMLAEIARAARTTALRIVYSTQLMVGRDSHLPPRCEEHAHHRDLPARATAETQAHASSAKDQDRHLMMTKLMLDICKYDQYLCWLPADNVIPRVVTSMLPFGKTQKRKIALLRRSVTRSQPNSRPCRVAKLRTLPPRSATSTPAPATKSP
jgi:hypothetical protein